MRRLLFGALGAMLWAACGGPTDSYVLTGTIKGAKDGDTVKLVQYEGWDIKVIDQTIVQNGSFMFEGRQDTADFYYVAFSNGELSSMTDVLLENGKIDMEIDPSSYLYTVKGTPLSEAWAKFDNDNERLCGESMEFYRIANDTTKSREEREKAYQDLEAKEKEIKDFRMKFSKDNITNVAGAYALAAYRKDFPMEEVERLVALIPDDCCQETVQAMKTEMKNLNATKVGAAYTDFSMPAIDGTTLSVSDVVKANKVTMIDFWASWCGPCRMEMPAVKAAYSKYHDKGFGIIGVSLDHSEEAWKKAVEELQLPWQHISDLKGWECAGAELYGVKAIPATVLIMDGKIVARNLRGDDIQKELEKLLAE